MIKGMINRFNKPGVPAKVTLKSMKLLSIPAQTMQVCIKVKQFRNSKTTQPVNISEDNTAKWDEPLTINCRVPKNSSSSTKKTKLTLHLSFRLIESSGNTYVRFGTSEIELHPIESDEYTTTIQLLKCNYKSEFTCEISVRPREIEDSNLLLKSDEIYNSSSIKFESITDSRRSSEYHSSFSSLNTSNSCNLSKEYDSGDIMIRGYRSTPLSIIAKSSFSLDDDDEDNDYANESSEKTEKLPFEVAESEMAEMSKQVNDIITEVLYSRPSDL
ncbi:hypothetical protein M9Y10_028995 [Tritrichomonas musculus]|uniref:C2 NT-type domain-containing protein n=1 Tax=Tritrichomonas musculus TaxID=1915356 RepID=A0ABR2KKW8_9EUKA